MITRDIIFTELKEVVDPELVIDIVTLGLVRDVEIGEYFEELDVHEYIKVVMTLTTPMCPFADAIVEDVKNTISLLGKGDVQIELTFDPPWQAPEELRLQLGI